MALRFLDYVGPAGGPPGITPCVFILGGRPRKEDPGAQAVRHASSIWKRGMTDTPLVAA
jgi:hypothetical protein